MKTKTSRPSGAPTTMHAIGQATDSAILAEIVAHPGVTVAEVAEALGWSNGKVDGSVNRLMRKNQVKVKRFLKKGTVVKKIYPSGYSATQSNVVEVPREIFDNSLWGNCAFVYALSRSTIGVTPRENKELAAKALLKERANVEKAERKVWVALSGRFSDFYQLENSETSVSIIGQTVLVTVETTLPIGLQATQPEASGEVLLRSSPSSRRR
jgi:predicted transcriptional regulator